MQEQSNSKNIFEHAILERGFRPFFLLGAIYSVISLLIWGCFYAGHITPPTLMGDPVSWHAHEMIYGYTMAIVAGFLLTAVANWTGGAPARQIHLASLCAIWIAGRIVINFNFGLPDIAIWIIDGAFIPALAISLSIPLLKSWNKRNFIFIILLTILFICNIAFYISQEREPLYIAILIITTMISLIGGRIIPAFTVAALRRSGVETFQTPQMKMDITALLSLALIIIHLAILGNEGIILAVLGIISASIHILRMRHYHTLKIFNDPMVWILHAGFSWVIIGLILISLSAIEIVPFSMALHALTAGAIGSMTLGMICRVALGHTGRELKANKLTALIFILIQITAILRVLGTYIFPEYTSLWIVSSALLWSLCFSIYILVYSAILWKPRIVSTRI